MRLLLVEDDQKIASFIVKGMRQAGFTVDHACDGEEGLDFALMASYDVAIVDIMLPKLDGLSLVEELRKRRNLTPVIILSAKRSVDDRVTGIQKGGDDYLVKPFSFMELLVRVQALIRRAGGTAENTSLNVGDLTIDLLQRTAYRGGKEIELQPREFALLEYLMRNAGRPLPKTLILEHIWGFHFDPQTNVVDVLVCRLRSKIDKDFSVKMIRTIRGIGYAIKATEKSKGNS
jgi:DNA-binding response OmpR family regulator